MPAWWIPMAITAAGSGISAYARYRSKSKALEAQKGFGGSEYERELQRQMKEGKYSPSAKRTMLGQVSRRAGQVAQIGKSGVSGYMESRGLGRSMIGQSAMKGYDTEVMNRIAETTREIELANESSKVQAKERYAMERYKDRIRRGQIKAGKYEAGAELAGGLIGAASTAVATGYQSYQANRTIADIFGGEESVPPDFRDFANITYKQAENISPLLGGGLRGRFEQINVDTLDMNQLTTLQDTLDPNDAASAKLLARIKRRIEDLFGG